MSFLRKRRLIPVMRSFKTSPPLEYLRNVGKCATFTNQKYSIMATSAVPAPVHEVNELIREARVAVQNGRQLLESSISSGFSQQQVSNGIKKCCK